MYSGDKIPVDKVVTEKLDKPMNVYNFRVADRHTYLVTDKGILVHNANYGKGTGNNEAKILRTGEEWNEHFKNKYGEENVSLKGTNPEDFLNTALKRQGLDTAPAKLKEPWIQGGYKYEVRIRPAEADYGKTGSIYRVSRQRIDITIGEGTGMEYIGTDGEWYHKSVLTPGKKGNVNPNFNDKAAEMTHIQLP